MEFNDKNIHALFGHEAAEAEDPTKLRGYYFKGKVYDRVSEDLPLRILVGHKGTGKSALFATAHAEELEKGTASLLIRPDDFDVSSVPEDQINLQIRAFKEKLIKLIFDSVAGHHTDETSDSLAERLRSGGKLIDVLIDVFKPKLKELTDVDVIRRGLHEAVVKSSTLNVYLDDLDRGWTGSKADIRRMSALLNALRDLSRIHTGLRFRLALRTDVYYLVRTSDESTDKIEGSVVWCAWSNHEILAMLIKRVCAFQGIQLSEAFLLDQKQHEVARNLSPIMELTFQGKGHWQNAPIHRVLMSLIRKRPRDLVKLCTLAAQRANSMGDQLIKTRHWSDSFQEYSEGRLTDTVNEYKSELPEIERLLLGMRTVKKELQYENPNIFTTDKLVQKIKSIQQSGAFRFSNGKTADPMELVRFMYKINFITARKVVNGRISRTYFEERAYIGNKFADFGNDWEIHPAYRWALQPFGIDSIYSSLELAEDV